METSTSVFLVTGASSGLGRAVAIAAGAARARVALVARRRGPLQEASYAALAAGAAAAVAIPADVGDPAELHAAFDQVELALGPVTVVVNAAGVLGPVARLSDADPEEWLAAVRTNLGGAFLVAREAIRRMNSRGQRGTVVGVSTGAAVRPYAGWSAYGAAKAGVDMMFRCAARETGVDVRLFAVNPGPFEGPMQQLIRQADPSAFPSRERFVRLHDEGLLPPPAWPARVVVALASADWPELHGRVLDLRDPEFQRECRERGLPTL